MAEQTLTVRGNSLAALVDRYGPGDDGPIRVRFPVEAGILVVGAFVDAVAFGRSIGATIEVHRGGGWLFRRYQVVVSGPWPATRRFLKMLTELEAL